MSAADYYATVQKIYIAYYGRAADPGGLEYWADRLDSASGNLSEIIEAFAHSAESEALFSSASNEEKVIAIYQQLFNRDPDSGGLAFYTEKLLTGEMSQATIMLNVLDGAQNEDLLIVENKLEAATAFTESLEQDGTADLYAGDLAASQVRNWLSTVDDTDDSLTNATEQLSEQIQQLGEDTQLSVSNITVDEQNSTATITINRSGYLGQESSLSYSTSDQGSSDSSSNQGVASAGEDYSSLSGNLTFASGENSQSIQITLTDDEIFEGNESFNLEFSDLVNAAIDQEEITITLIENDSPLFNTEDFNPTVNEDETLSGAIQATNLASSITVSYSLATQAKNGTVTLESDGSYQYLPNENHNGSDSFQVTATTDLDTEELLTLNITIDPINDAPVFSEDILSLETIENTSVQGSVNADDIDSSELTYSLNSNPSQGNVELDEQGNYTYTPNDGFSGSDSFSINVDDGAEGVDTLEVSVTVVGTSSQLSISNLTIDETEATASIDIIRSGYLLHETSLNYGMDNNTASADEDFTAISGSLTFASGETSKTIDITLIDDNLAEGEESFFLALTDLVNGTINQELIEITLNDNDEVTFNTEDFSPNVDEDNTLEGNIQATNLASGINASYSLTTQTQNGTVTLDSDGSYQYASNTNYNGSDSFQVTATTDLGTEDLLTLDITVDPINDAPVFSEDTLSLETTENVSIQGSVSADDIDSSELTYSLNNNPNQGSLELDEQGNYTYTPNDGFSGSDSFSINVDDGVEGIDTLEVSVTVIDTSTQLSTSNLTIDESESTASITITRSGYLLHETSLNYGMDNNTASAGEDFTADSGSLTFTSGETSKTIDITLTDDNLAEDEESFFLALTDIVNGTVNQDLIEITLNDNDEVAFNTEDFSPNVDEDNALEGNVQATNLASGITASYSLTTQAQNGTVTLEDDGSYQYTPNSNYNGSDSFQVSATTDLGTEDLLTLNITIASVNDAPLFSETPVTIETNANTPVQSSVSATDIDSSELSYSVTGAASQGNVVVDDQGNYTYTPTDGFSGSDSFVITVDDNDGGTDDITVQVTVNSSLEEAQQFSRTETGINTDAMLSLGDTPIESLESDEYWSNNNLTYSFNQSIPDEYNDPDLELDLTGWTSLSSAAESAVEDVMSTLEAFTDLTLTENTSDNGDIRFNAIQQTDGTAAFAYYPSPSDIGGDVFLDSESLSSADYQPGAFTYHTLIHELGHALGLKHSFESPNAIDNNLDNLDYTVMSYTEAKNLVVNFDYDAQNTSISADYEWDAMPPSFSILDVAALQAIYGVNTDSATGDNSYSLSFDDQTYLTIWDAGGEDTINVSTTTGDSHIDLRSGQLSSVDIRTIDEQIAETLDWLDDQNAPDFSDFVNGVYQDEANNLYTGENNLAITYGVWIENVITGSGNDEIRDNAINNNIQTGAGNDLIRLYEGGLDTVDGGSGEDTVALNTTSSQVSVESLGGDSYLLLGNDFAAEIIGVEILSFTDTDIALA